MTAARTPPPSGQAVRLQPRIDRNRCEGKGDCVVVCPQGVFSLGVLPVEQRRGLRILGLLKGHAHGWRQALTPALEACSGCGRCVTACPERAITLVRAGHNGARDSGPPDAPTAAA